MSVAKDKADFQSKMKGAFGKMKSSSSKLKLPDFNTSSRKQFKDLQFKDLRIFTSFNKKDEEQKWARILSGTWEIEIPVDEFMNAIESPAASDNDADKPTSNASAVNDPNSVSNRQMPMVQISDDLKVISLPLSTDIANPEIHKRYLSAKSISTNATRLKIEGKDGVKLVLVNSGGADEDNQIESSLSTQEHDSVDDSSVLASPSSSSLAVVMEGTICTDSFAIRWMDGSSWSKQGVADADGDDEQPERSTPSHTLEEHPKAGNYNKDYEAELSGLRAQLEILKEKQHMAKSSSQATMGQLADLSAQYAKLSMQHEQVQKTHAETTHKYQTLHNEFEALSAQHSHITVELDRVKAGMQFAQQQEMQMQFTRLKAENTAYAQSITSQQQRILSLQDQLQSAQLTSRQYTKNIEDLETRLADSDKSCAASRQALSDVNAKLIESETRLDDEKHREQQLAAKQQVEIAALTDRHTQEIEKLERGFQETLQQNEKKMQDLQTLRNNYEKKNASLTKDVKKLIVQLEKQTKSYRSKNRVSASASGVDMEDIAIDDETLKKIRYENAQLSEELIRKSQSLVDALHALTEFHANPDTVKAITSQLSHAPQYAHNNGFDKHHQHEHEQKTNSLDADLPKTKSVSSYADVSNRLQMSMEHDMKSVVSSPSTLTVSPAAHAEEHVQVPTSPMVIGAQFSVHDIASQQTKFGRFKTRVGYKMKEQITKVQQQMVTHQIQKHKHSEQESLNELNAKSVIKETEKVLSMKTRQQLSTQCDELQSLANELSSTIEQKEVILESLRFANTYLGHRVIAIEKLSKMQPGQLIQNQDQLIRDAINSTTNATHENEDESEAADDNDTSVLPLNMSTSRVHALPVTLADDATLPENSANEEQENEEVDVDVDVEVEVDRVALTVVESDLDLLRPKNTISHASLEQKTIESDAADTSERDEHSREEQTDVQEQLQPAQHTVEDDKLKNEEIEEDADYAIDDDQVNAPKAEHEFELQQQQDETAVADKTVDAASPDNESLHQEETDQQLPAEQLGNIDDE